MKPERFTIIFNVRVNSDERYRRLILAVKRIPKIDGLNFSIRIRGSLKKDSFQLRHPSCLYFESTWNEWNLDVIEQVTASPSNYYILMQEDHLLKMSKLDFIKLLSEVEACSIDYLPLSFHPHYEIFVKELTRNFSTNESKNGLIFWDLDKQNYAKSNLKNRNYPLNLIGVYKRELLLRVLIRSRPFYKQYSIQTPFNFERKPNETWFLPIRWAYPINEVFACIDDDHGIEDYSLMSRGEYRSKIVRVVEHHDVIHRNSPEKFIWLKKSQVKRMKSNIQVFPRNIRYSLEFLLTMRKRHTIIKKLLQDLKEKLYWQKLDQ